MWDSFVEILRATIFSVAHLCGGSLGGGIMLVSAGVRLALLPLTLRLARRAREQQALIATSRRSSAVTRAIRVASWPSSVRSISSTAFGSWIHRP
jgi:hypothetical protein